jgi:hypothetical protein
MISINDPLFENWWSEMVNHPEDTDAHLDALQFMIDEQGLNIDEENIEGLTICDLIIHELEDSANEIHTEIHRLNLEQILQWLFERITPTTELIKSFHYNNHMLEEILKRYEGPQIDFNGWQLNIDFLEVLIGFDNVVDTIKMEKIYRKAIESKHPIYWVFIEN